MSANPYHDMNTGIPAPTLPKPKYRWKVPHNQYKVGDLVPDSYGSGIVSTMLRAGRVELIPDAPRRKRKDVE